MRLKVDVTELVADVCKECLECGIDVYMNVCVCDVLTTAESHDSAELRHKRSTLRTSMMKMLAVTLLLSS